MSEINGPLDDGRDNGDITDGRGTYDVVLLVEQAMSKQDAEQVRSLHNEIADVLEESSRADVEWTLTVATGVDVADTVLDLIADSDVELLVIGARHRSPVGKLIMGSVTQSIVLRADVPVLVVKAPART